MSILKSETVAARATIQAARFQGCIKPSKGWILKEERTVLVDEARINEKKSIAVTLTYGQIAYLKTHGGSVWLRDLITWFMGQEQRAVANCKGALDDYGSFSFNGYPVLFDVEDGRPLWETYFWAKETGTRNPIAVVNHIRSNGGKV